MEHVIDTSPTRLLGMVSGQCMCVCNKGGLVTLHQRMSLGWLRMGCAGAKKKKGNLQYPYRAVIKSRHIKAVLVANRNFQEVSVLPSIRHPFIAVVGKVYALILKRLPRCL